MTSIRSRLLVIVSALMAATLVGLLVLIGHHVNQVIHRRFDLRLSHEVALLAKTAQRTYRIMARANGAGESPALIALDIYPAEKIYGVWLDGRFIAGSEGARELPRVPHDGRVDVQIGTGPWRAFYRTLEVGEPEDRHSLQLVVAEKGGHREILTREIAAKVAWPLFLALPLVALAIFFGIGHGLRPLRRLADHISRRTPQQLHAVTDVYVPAEAQPLVTALNTLFERLQHSFSAERRFTEHAAHELRTPLSGLKAQAEVALRASTDEQLRDGLDKIILGANRASHLVSQLLTLARLDPQASIIDAAPVELGRVIAETLAEMSKHAEQKNVHLEFERPAATIVRGDATYLAVLARNLVENAIQFSPPGGGVLVRVAQDERGITLSITDSGIGVQEAERDKIFARFYRVPDSPGFGSGLGLSIVKHIVDLHSATIEAASGANGRGLTVIVRFKPHSESRR